MAFKYLVDYVKMIIKDKIASGKFKFMALVVLKEATKTNDPTLTNYLDTKILKRLYKLAASAEGERCLTIYDKKVNLDDSARFHYLLRECFTNWGSKFKSINKSFISFTKQLSKKKLVPAPNEKYWNFPQGAAINEELRGNSIFEDFPDRISQSHSDLSVSDVSRSRSLSPNVQRNPPEINQIGLIIRNFIQQFTNTTRASCPSLY